MEFHEDFIFKCYAQNFGSELIEILDIVGEIIEVLPSEYPDIEPKIYKPDIVFELKDKILILEFQSTNVNNEDKRRFRHYTSLLDLNVIKSEKPSCLAYSKIFLSDIMK